MIFEGSTAYITTTFHNLAGALADPVSVTVLIQAPDGTQTTPTPTHPSLGVFLTAVPVPQRGVYFFEVTGSGGGVDVVDVGSFCVTASLVPV